MQIEKVFPATDAAYIDASAWLEETLEQLECPMKLVMQISMCFEEAFINIAHYAYGKDTGDMTFSISYDKGIVTLCLKDHGVAFDPTAKTDPDITAGMEERDIGGLGIFLVKEMMDSVTYQRVDNENILTFTKKIKDE